MFNFAQGKVQKTSIFTSTEDNFISNGRHTMIE